MKQMQTTCNHCSLGCNVDFFALKENFEFVYK